jgi:hypothetical protein
MAPGPNQTCPSALGRRWNNGSISRQQSRLHRAVPQHPTAPVGMPTSSDVEGQLAQNEGPTRVQLEPQPTRSNGTRSFIASSQTVACVSSCGYRRWSQSAAGALDVVYMLRESTNFGWRSRSAQQDQKTTVVRQARGHVMRFASRGDASTRTGLADDFRTAAFRSPSASSARTGGASAAPHIRASARFLRSING